MHENMWNLIMELDVIRILILHVNMRMNVFTEIQYVALEDWKLLWMNYLGQL